MRPARIFAKWAELTHASASAYAFRRWIMASVRSLVRRFVNADRVEASGQRMWNEYQGCCLRVMTGSSVLDVGCGPGEQRAEVVELWRARRYAGVDLSYGMVRDAHRLWADSLFLAASAQGLPLRDGSFDVVTSSFLFHHIPPADRLTALREQLRVGNFVLLRDLHAIELGLTAWFYGLYSSVFDGSERRFTAPEWRQFLAAAGAEILAEGYANTDHVLGRHCFFLLRQTQSNA